ncbi:hypothetical protein R1sor_025272 [Riccia sorocarpa]|uniref:Uncharacterized protein n=1 Tax=Riccia sorocarpa TaxID=122646 RepID=A0ABD3GC22_9MARC
MTETPTIAEAFLTGFSSINPLTAHAVLSCCPLKKFVLLALEQQYALVQVWDVPRRSLELFKAQCSYREIVDCINEAVRDEYHYREGPSHIIRGSDVKEGGTIFDGQKTEVYPSNSERIVDLTEVGNGKAVFHQVHFIARIRGRLESIDEETDGYLTIVGGASVAARLSSKETQHSIGSLSILRGSVPVDKGPKLLLGLTRRGNDKQQRLVGINTSKEAQNVLKRQKILSDSRFKCVDE